LCELLQDMTVIRRCEKNGNTFATQLVPQTRYKIQTTNNNPDVH